MASINDNMSKRSVPLEAEAPLASSQEARLSVWLKAVISLLLAVHLTAVSIAPLAVACNMSSPAVEPVRRALQPYIAALFLDHGYFFFAPEAGPSHLVDYKLEFADGTPPVEGRFPNLATERPRLLYHRYFMLSEALNASFVPPETPPEPSPPPLTAGPAERSRYQNERSAYAKAASDWQRRRKQYEAMRTSIEDHLRAASGADRVTLTRVQHRLPLPDDFDALGRKLNDADSYVKLSETSNGGGR